MQMLATLQPPPLALRAPSFSSSSSSSLTLSRLARTLQRSIHRSTAAAERESTGRAPRRRTGFGEGAVVQGTEFRSLQVGARPPTLFQPPPCSGPGSPQARRWFGSVFILGPATSLQTDREEREEREMGARATAEAGRGEPEAADSFPPDSSLEPPPAFLCFCFVGRGRSWGCCRNP